MSQSSKSDLFSKQSVESTGSSTGHEGIDNAIAGLEKRTNKKMESSNAEIAMHINSLSERLAKVEKAPMAAKAWAPKQQTKSRVDLEWMRDQQRDQHRDDRSEGGKSQASQGSMFTDVDPDRIDPDERQRHYSDFLAVTEKNMKCVGVLSWSMCRATRQSSTFCGALLGMLPCILIVILQCVMFHAVSLQALNPSCKQNADCRAGMWCAPTRGFTMYQSTPGKCEDCLWAKRMQDEEFTKLPSWLRKDAYDVMDPFALATAASYCDAYVAANEADERCDYLDRWHDHLTLGPFLVVITVIAVVLHVVTADLDQDEACLDVFVYRLDRVAEFGCCQRGIIRTIASIVFNVRTFVLPGMVTRTYIALVLTGPPAPGLAALPVAGVLAGVAVLLVQLADRLFGLVLLDDTAHKFVREAYGDEVVKMEVEKQEELAPARLVAYFGHRVYAGVLWVMVVAVLLSANTIMSDLYFFDLGAVMKDGSIKHPGPYNNCTNVSYMLGMISTTYVISCTFGWMLTYQVLYKFASAVAILIPSSRQWSRWEPSP